MAESHSKGAMDKAIAGFDGSVSAGCAADGYLVYPVDPVGGAIAATLPGCVMSIRRG